MVASVATTAAEPRSAAPAKAATAVLRSPTAATAAAVVVVAAAMAGRGQAAGPNAVAVAKRQQQAGGVHFAVGTNYRPQGRDSEQQLVADAPGSLWSWWQWAAWVTLRASGAVPCQPSCVRLDGGGNIEP